MEKLIWAYDSIIMSNMAFFGYHGVLTEESRLGQKFFVDARLYLDMSEAGKNDDLTKTVSYAEVYTLVKGIVEKGRFRLLEALAETIAEEVLENFPILQGITLEVRKPEAPVPGIFDHMGVAMTRMRKHNE